MKLQELTVNEFISAVDSKSPTPGGGSVSALAATLGVALARMVGHLTIGRKRFEALDDSAKSHFTAIFNEMEIGKNQLMNAIDADTDAYNEVMAAFKLPKENEHQISFRNKAIQQATIKAIEVPLYVAKVAYSLLQKIEPIILYGNQNTISDMGVGVMMIESAIEGAILNVKINLSGLEDKELAHDYQNEDAGLLSEANQLRISILEGIHTRLNIE
jgi:formiminotetrahydrofolate cyclodeaminase